MIRFFQIGRAKLRPTTHSFRSADKPVPAAFTPQLSTVTTPAAPAITQEIPTMEHTTSAPAAPARFFAQIRLGDAAPVDSAVIERHALAFGDATVRRLASRCAAALEQLVHENAFSHFASMAIEAAQTEGSTPACWLEQALHTLEAETAAARIERGRHDARVKARSDRLQPLKSAVDARLTACVVEGPRLAERVRLAEAAPFGHQSPSQYQRLIDAGLTHEQIRLTGVENPVSQTEKDIEAAKARIAVLRAELPALRAFSADPRCSPMHLEGLAGFDALIAASLNIVEEPAA